MVNQSTILTALARLMGKRTLPQGDNSDWEDYAQTAFDYAWRYYKWDWSLRYATVDLVNTPYMPEDFDIGGYREAIATTDGEIGEITLSDYARLSAPRAFSLEFDSSTNRYKVYSKTGLSSIKFVYQVKPPTLGETYVPFPSSMSIAMGAAIYAKQAQNPTRANVDQEWDIFHKELNRHVGRSDINKPRNTNMNLQDYHGTYTGDTRY